MKASRLVLLALALFIVTFAAVFGAISLYNRWKDQSKPLVLWESSPGTIPVVESGQPIPDFADAAEKILPSMVSIETLVEGENWFGDRFVEKGGSGSGVIISKDGYILTNNHVIAYGGRVAARVIVALPDGTSEEAEIVGRDPRSDLAVLKVEKDGLTRLSLGIAKSYVPASG